MSITIEQLRSRIEKLEKENEQQRLRIEKLEKDKEDKKEDKKEKTKRKPTGYNLFCKAMRDDAKDIINNDLEEGEKPSNQDVMSKLGEMWQQLTQEEKDDWKEKAAAEN